MQKAKTSSYAHISSIVTVGPCPRVKMNSPDRRPGVLLDERSRVVYPLGYKCLQGNNVVIFPKLFGLFTVRINECTQTWYSCFRAS